MWRSGGLLQNAWYISSKVSHCLTMTGNFERIRRDLLWISKLLSLDDWCPQTQSHQAKKKKKDSLRVKRCPLRRPTA